MKDKITLKEFFESKEKLVIHCDTEEKANKLLKEFVKLGKKWCTGISYLEYNNYWVYGHKTCYTNDGFYCDIEYYENEDIKIYSFEDIIFEEDKPKNTIPEIAKMLGVTVGEEFFVVERGHTKYKLDLENGLMYFDILRNRWIRSEITLNELLLNLSTIQKLPNKPQLTEDERVILENLPKEYKWIARDEDEALRVLNSEPFKTEGTNFWRWRNGDSLPLQAFGHLFQFIKWSDDNPYNIEELLKGE